MLMNEFSILKKADHPHIVKIYEMYEDNAYYYIVCEVLSGGELFDRIIEKGTVDEVMSAGIIKQTMECLNFIHQQNIIHRDLKPENLMFVDKNSNTIKLVDFGFAKVFDPKKGLNEMLGTPLYIAPEIISGKKYSTKVDVWSLGVIAYSMLCGAPPFYGKNRP